MSNTADRRQQRPSPSTNNSRPAVLGEHLMAQAEREFSVRKWTGWVELCPPNLVFVRKGLHVLLVAPGERSRTVSPGQRIPGGARGWSAGLRTWDRLSSTTVPTAGSNDLARADNARDFPGNR